ncbi:X-box-binding protein 1 isoform X4 [Hemicordylus capensis]|uniref:X-box-binding protein 1 isoform X4 n=1 Tax=Hemicordylus capensis TaxID=884348 RepID=UPI00230448A6|nr:X-box-binding protein 1 isoform X4 [Hemicordylus capensis]
MAPLPQARLLLLPAAAPAASSCPASPPRKRQRLAHLSPEEKALRRKLKNRVAAQSARDRKKARMGELERQALELEAENLRLVAENQALKEQGQQLSLENRELRLRLGLPALPPSEPRGEDFKSDLLLGLLDSLDPDMFLRCSGPEAACLEKLQQEVCGGEADSLPASPCSPLGPTPPQLEAINELIRFDHEYTKPFFLEIVSGEGGQTNMLVRQEEAVPSPSERGPFEPPVSVKEEPADLLSPELGISHLLCSAQKPLLDASSDSGYEGSLSPFSDLASPLDTEYGWQEAFANELFPQLISV